MDFLGWEHQFKEKIAELTAPLADPSHDFLHFQRVVNWAKKIALRENALLEVVLPAAWLHDFVIVPKDSPLRSQASKLAAEAAIQYLRSVDYPHEFLEGIYHAIEGHSFSANVSTQSLEAQIVQDADRLDALGAVGIARCFATGALLKRPFYSAADPFCRERTPDDSRFTLDHFYKKLFRIVERLNTETARLEGARRLQSMRVFIEALSTEIEDCQKG